MEISSSCCTEINIHIDLRRFSQGSLCSFLKEVKPLVLYAVEYGIAMEPMKGKWPSSRVDLGYTELFYMPEVTSVFLSFCESGLGHSLVFHQANRGSLGVRLGTRDCSARNAGESRFISQRGGCLMGLLELQVEPGVYSRVTVVMAIQNSTLFSEVRSPV